MALGSGQLESRRYRASRRLACWLGAAVAALGLVVLAGWAFGIAWLTTLSPVDVRVKANTSLALILLGVALWLRTAPRLPGGWRHRVAQAAAGVALLVAGATLLEYALNIDLGIDQLLGAEPAPEPGTPFPGRIAPGTALGLGLLAGALVAMPPVGAPPRRRDGLYQVLTVLGASIGLVALLGYLYGAAPLYAPGELNAISLPTAVALLVLAAALLLARPSRGVVGLVLSDQLGGVAARQLLPAALGLPLAVGLLRAAGERSGAYGTEVGLAFFTVATMGAFTALAWWAALRLNAADAGRHMALKRTQRLQALTAALLQAATPEDVIRIAVEQGAAALGTPGGYLFLLSPDGQALELAASRGIPQAAVVRLARVPLDAPVAAAVVYRTGQAEWYADNASLLAQYPVLAEVRAATGHQAGAILPLPGQGRTLGVMAFAFSEARVVTPDDQAFGLAVAQQCAQALDRAQLFREAQSLNIELEARVARRTAELTAANAQLAQSREALRRLSARLSSGHEEQRRQVAVAVHEGLAQQLSRLRMDVAWLRQHLDPAAGLLVERTEGMAALLNAAIQMARAIAAGLRPAVLDEFGLEAALEAELADFEQRWGGQATLYAPDDATADLTPSRATTLFRLVQEALDNVARHAAATTVEVHMVHAESYLEVCVDDNGRGLPAGAADDPYSLGLVSMRERMAQLGGSVYFDSAPGQGTRVTFRMPAAGGS